MLYNYNYGILSEDKLVYAPANLEIDGTWYIPAKDEQYKQANYCQIITTEQPDMFSSYRSYWKQEEGKIVQCWEKLPDPVDTRTPSQKRSDAYQTRLCVIFPERSETYITIDEAVKLVLENLISFGIVKSLDEIGGVGHRIVQGGAYFSSSHLLDEYSCEETDRAKEIVEYLREVITVCKDEIRKEFPDEE